MRAPAQCPFPARVWLLPWGQGGRLPKSALLPGSEGTRGVPISHPCLASSTVSGFFHGGQGGRLPKSAFSHPFWPLPRGQGGRPSKPFCHPCPVFFPAGRGGLRPGVGASARKRPKCLFLQCFTVGRAFLQPSRSVSRFSKSQSRGQRQHESAKHGGSEGSHCEPVYHPHQGGRLPESALFPPASGLFHGGSEGIRRVPVSRPCLASSTGAGRASARERPSATCVWPLPRGQRGHPKSAHFPPVSGFFHGGRRATVRECPFTRAVWPPPRGQGGQLTRGVWPLPRGQGGPV